MKQNLPAWEKYPAQNPLLLVCARDGVGPGKRDIPPAFYGQLLLPPWNMSCVCIDRHQGGVNGLFCGMTVRKVGLKELWTLQWYSTFNVAGPWTKAGGVQPENWPQWMRGFKEY